MTKIDEMLQVAIRLKGLRDALDLTIGQFAESLNIDEQTYTTYESGKVDIPVSFLSEVAKTYNVELPALLFDEDPKMDSYFVTRAGKGAKIERTAAYCYQSLADGFKNRVFDPMFVTVEPNDKPITLNSHEGQEWNCVIEGRMEIQIAEKTIILDTGDSIMFKAKLPHRMKALDNKTVQFIATFT